MPELENTRTVVGTLAVAFVLVFIAMIVFAIKSWDSKSKSKSARWSMFGAITCLVTLVAIACKIYSLP